jgi:arabinose-5-phosphate isomerase
LGDALAVALLDAKGFGETDFARSHPGGSLGRRLLTHVGDVMHTHASIPSVPENATLADAVLEISRKGLGMTAIVDGSKHLLGIYTDGDLRRTLEKKVDFSTTPVSTVMSRSPRSIHPDALAVDAVQLMEKYNISQLPVVDSDKKLVGALNMLDLLKAKVI